MSRSHQCGTVRRERPKTRRIAENHPSESRAPLLRVLPSSVKPRQSEFVFERARAVVRPASRDNRSLQFRREREFDGMGPSGGRVPRRVSRPGFPIVVDSSCSDSGHKFLTFTRAPTSPATHATSLLSFANGLSPSHACIVDDSSLSPTSFTCRSCTARRTVSRPSQIAVIVFRSLVTYRSTS